MTPYIVKSIAESARETVNKSSIYLPTEAISAVQSCQSAKRMMMKEKGNSHCAHASLHTQVTGAVKLKIFTTLSISLFPVSSL